ncbi:hypothetical protein HF086_016303, partial [Spodoptera exigua]
MNVVYDNEVAQMEDLIQHYEKLLEEKEENNLFNELIQTQPKIDDELLKFYQLMNDINVLKLNSLHEIPKKPIIGRPDNVKQ